MMSVESSRRSQARSLILASLRRARRRWLATRLLVALLVAGTAWAAALPAAVVVRRVIGAGGGSVASPDLLLAFAVFTVSAVSGAAWTLLNAPSLRRVARWIDDRLGFEDRLVTAIGLPEPPAATERSLVVEALIEDACRHAARIDIPSVFPFRWPRWGLVMPALVGLAFAIPLFPMPTAAPVEDAQRRVEFDAASAASTLRRLSEALSQDASTTDDAYLRAVTAAFTDLADRLDDGGVDDDAFERDVGHLLDHLAAAVEGRDDSLAERIADLLGWGRERNEAPPAEGAQHDVHQDGAGDDAEPTHGVRDGVALLDRLSEEVAAFALEEADARRTRTTPEARVDDRAGVDDYTMDSEIRPPAGEAVDAEAGGSPAGAAEESDESPGDAAGAGAQPEEVAVPDTSFAGVDTDEQAVELPWSESDDGTRIDRDVLPEAAEIHFALDATTGDVPHHRADEASTGTEAVGGRYRHVVRHYFLPTSDGDMAGGP